MMALAVDTAAQSARTSRERSAVRAETQRAQLDRQRSRPHHRLLLRHPPLPPLR